MKISTEVVIFIMACLVISSSANNHFRRLMEELCARNRQSRQAGHQEGEECTPSSGYCQWVVCPWSPTLRIHDCQPLSGTCHCPQGESCSKIVQLTPHRNNQVVFTFGCKPDSRTLSTHRRHGPHH